MHFFGKDFISAGVCSNYVMYVPTSVNMKYELVILYTYCSYFPEITKVTCLVIHAHTCDALPAKGIWMPLLWFVHYTINYTAGCDCNNFS